MLSSFHFSSRARKASQAKRADKEKAPSGYDHFKDASKVALDYANLDESVPEIRLLRFAACPEPRRAGTLIVCELLDKVPLARMHGSYAALSYYTGSTKETRDTSTVVNGKSIKLFTNLERALTAVLRHWGAKHPGRELLIWVDQIGINHNDEKERSSQVRLMRDIYRRAGMVFASLSSNEPQTN